MFGLTSAEVRKFIGRSIKPQTQSPLTAQVPPSIASEEVEDLPPEIFTDAVDIKKITTLEQRLQHPEVQAEKINELRPQHKQFLVKRSQRCRVCEHNVSKSDMCSQSTKFKIQLAAFYHVPEIRIVTCEPLRAGKASELLLKFCNPTRYQTQITLLSIDTPISPTTSVIEEKEDTKQEGVQGSESPNLLPSIVRHIPVIEEPKPLKINTNADLILPHSPLILPPRDDTAEYDDTDDTYNFQDDPKLVVWRKAHKAVLRLHVTPYEIEQNGDDSVVVGFIMQYGYINTITGSDNKGPRKLDLRVKVYLTLGKVVGAT